MAYKPKFAGPRSAPQNPERPQRPERPENPERPHRSQRPEQPQQPQKSRVGQILLGIVVIPISLAATALLFRFLFTHVGAPQTASADVPAFTVSQAIHTLSREREAAALERLRQTPEETKSTETAPPETTEPPVVHLHYSIPGDAAVAPLPDPGGYGASADPAVLAGVLAEADWLLDGQTTYFDPGGQRYDAEPATKWYFDESMLVLTWKEVHDGSVYTFSEVQVQDPSQFRRHLAGGEYGSQMQYLTTEMAESVNAVVASAGDFYRFRDFGAVVYEGVARRVEGTYAETCYIDRSGDMHFTYGGEVLTVKDVQAFVDEHDIAFSLAFGPVLVADGQKVDHTWYGVGEINEGYARAALCQMGNLHYLLVTANTQGNYQEIPTVEMFRNVIAATGCVHAYCLDGGQTASIVMGGQLINRPVYGQQRKISDIIYFATAVPEEE